jgi:hypothetical protein
MCRPGPLFVVLVLVAACSGAQSTASRPDGVADTVPEVGTDAGPEAADARTEALADLPGDTIAPDDQAAAGDALDARAEGTDLSSGGKGEPVDAAEALDLAGEVAEPAAEAVNEVEAHDAPAEAPPEVAVPHAGTLADPIPLADFPYVVDDDTRLSASDAVAEYACAPGVGEDGPERVYRLELPAAGTLTVEVLEDAGVDVDVHVLTDLALDDEGRALHCVARANTRLVQPGVGPGTVYVVVDSYGQGEGDWGGPHRLAIEHVVPDTWHERVVAPGVLWRKKVYSSQFGGPQTVNVLEVETTDPAVQVKPWWAAGACATVRAKGQGYGAIAALNGGFFDTANSPAACPSLDLVKIDGVVKSYNHLTGADQPTLGLSPAEVATIAPWPANHDWAEMPNALGGYPNLLTDGQIDVWPAATSIAGKNPRTAVGVQADGTLLLVVVDGRTEAGIGMTFDELAEYMAWLGAVDAANLDGGGSTTLWIAGQSINGVVNHPSDNGEADHWGERPVSDGLLVLPQ